MHSYVSISISGAYCTSASPWLQNRVYRCLICLFVINVGIARAFQGFFLCTYCDFIYTGMQKQREDLLNSNVASQV